MDIKDIPIYLLMVSYQGENSALSVIEDFLKATKPEVKTVFIILENSEQPMLDKLFDFSSHDNLLYHHYSESNKANAINHALTNLIEEDQALVVCIDNDIRFNPDYLLKFFQAAEETGTKFYFGTSFFVEFPDFNQALIPYLSGSALGQPDLQFEKMQRLMFLGFSYAFFKSQWRKVGGLDERFAPGSKYGLSADESVFQKKLRSAGYKPFLVKNNTVQHKPLPILYTMEKVVYRQRQNGLTHGFQNIVASKKLLKWDCLKTLIGHIKRCVVLYFQKDKLKYKMKLAYTTGFLNSFFLYFRIEDRSNFIKISN